MGQLLYRSPDRDLGNKSYLSDGVKLTRNVTAVSVHSGLSGSEG